MSIMDERTVRAVLWRGIEIAARFGTRVVVTVVLARLLSPNDFGLIAMLVVFTSLGSLLIDSGFGSALVQRKALTDDDETTVFWFNVGTAVLVAGLLWIGAGAIAGFFV